MNTKLGGKYHEKIRQVKGREADVGCYFRQRSVLACHIPRLYLLILVNTAHLLKWHRVGQSWYPLPLVTDTGLGLGPTLSHCTHLGILQLGLEGRMPLLSGLGARSR